MFLNVVLDFVRYDVDDIDEEAGRNGKE